MGSTLKGERRANLQDVLDFLLALFAAVDHLAAVVVVVVSLAGSRKAGSLHFKSVVGAQRRLLVVEQVPAWSWAIACGVEVRSEEPTEDHVVWVWLWPVVVGPVTRSKTCSEFCLPTCCSFEVE